MTRETYIFLNKHFAPRHRWTRVLHFFAAQIVYVYGALPCILVWFPAGRQYIITAGAGLILGWGVLTQLIAYAFPHKRPYQQFGYMPLAGKALFSRIDKRFDSFPSGHTTALTILTLVGAGYSLPLACMSAGIVLATAVSRVLLGYHYPIDIIGGFIIAVLVVVPLQYFGIFAYILSSLPY